MNISKPHKNVAMRSNKSYGFCFILHIGRLMLCLKNFRSYKAKYYSKTRIQAKKILNQILRFQNKKDPGNAYMYNDFVSFFRLCLSYNIFDIVYFQDMKFYHANLNSQKTSVHHVHRDMSSLIIYNLQQIRILPSVLRIKMLINVVQMVFI